MIHALDARLHGHWRGRIQSNDNDNVLVISIDPTLQLDELTHLFGSSKQVCYLPSHAIATSLGREKAGVLPTFHAPAGYNTFQVETNEDGEERVGHVLRAYSRPEGAADVAGAYWWHMFGFAILSCNRPSSLCKVKEVKQELFSTRSFKEFFVLKSPYCILKEVSSIDFV